MGRSLGFGSTRGDSDALFRLAFAAAPSFSDLTLPPASNSPAHSSKGTPLGYLVPEGSRQHPLTACRHSVSGTVSLPFRGAFHLSLTVLVHYRSPRVFSLGRWSAQIPTEFHVFRGTWEHPMEVAHLSPTGLSPAVAGLSRTVRLDGDLVTPCPPGRGDQGVPRPRDGNACRLSRRRGLGCPRFARHYSGDNVSSCGY